MSQSPAILVLQCELVSHLKGLRRENTWNLIVNGLQPLPLASPGELRL